jgi:ketosteroid isomerase-like protein
VFQWWRAEADVPQEVFDEGKEAIREYLMKQVDYFDYIQVEHSEVDEGTLDIDEIETCRPLQLDYAKSLETK